ncbi:MAG TPA: hypothetical protein VH934_02210 [Xanthobacteraceae bacterium]|jgi:hypothetical protein
MHALARGLTVIMVVLGFAAAAAAQTCEYAGQTFSAGATICECPTLRLVRNSGGGRGEITSRRLACSKDQGWVKTETLCLVAYTWPDRAEAAFRKFHATYCPRLPVNHAEIERALGEETEKFFATASRSQALIAVQAICRRHADLSASCQAMIQGLSAAGN